MIDPAVAVAGLAVGFVVGMTGMGGGALMTPLMILLFKVEPLAAVSSDLVVSLLMKPVGGAVHARRGTVNRPLVGWLVCGSVPSAFAGVLLLRALTGHDPARALKPLLGAVLVVAAVSIGVKAALQRHRDQRTATGGGSNGPGASDSPEVPVTVRPAATVAIGAVGGLLVGLTSVGSGSVVIVLLLLLYPTLRSAQLVGTDLVQAVPLVAAAALGHLLFGDVRLGLTASLVVGALPGVYAGARISARAPDRVVKPTLALVMAASGLKLLGAV